MNVKCFEFNIFPVNTYVVWDNVSKDAIIIDPGCYYSGESDTLQKYIEDNGLTVKHLLNTHLHFDHIFGNPFVERTFHVKAQANDLDMNWLINIKKKIAAFGMKYEDNISPIEPENVLHEGDTIKLSDTTIYIFHIPGHSPGSLVYYFKEDGILFSGDVLFQDCIGRTDFADGNAELLPMGIRTKLFALPDDTIVYPGHGPATTIGHEKRHNMYL